MVNVLFGVLVAITAGVASDSAPSDLRTILTFHSGFDGSFNARFANGDFKLYTASSTARTDAKPGNHRKDLTIIKDGRFGSALRFGDKAKQVVFFKAEDNMHYSKTDFSGTVSFWLRLDPAKDLKPGYVDPLQITDKKWNDASFFVDFTKDDTPRHFRLGSFSDYKFWNPTDIKWDEFPTDERPLVVVRNPPFSRSRWTHVLFTFADFNTKGKLGKAKLFLNGKLQGTQSRPQHYTWDASKAAIMLGLSYIGDFDDLALFSRALTEKEIQQLHELDGGVKRLYDRSSRK
jgi:hypothetical protein